MIVLNVRLFGALRRLSPDALVCLKLEQPVTVGELRQLVAKRLEELEPTARELGLLPSCAIASSKSVLQETESISETGELALLPPVSGG